ncbi:MAG TPA: hypothetical protein VK400_08945 [Pyrinomonadaceae bacterium]|nr:hypothetical protein [Pyrinomonadaceae bacterium]
MPAYNVYLAALGSHGLTSAEQTDIQTKLTTWFNRITNGTSYGTASVSWTTAAPGTIGGHELLIYFVADATDSILVSMPGGRLGAGDGFTMWSNNVTGSEIYVSSSRQYLAEMAFHELMHNKLHLGDAALHARDGLAHIPVTAGTAPSATNVTEMRAALATSQPQWTGGWAAYSDPMRGL